MTNWTKAVVHPLGLAGYALACVFGVIAKYGPVEKWPWLPPVAVAMAVVALIAGLLLASRESNRTATKSPQGLVERPTTQHTGALRAQQLPIHKTSQ